MRELIIDTETTGLTHLSFANSNNFQKWPRLVQFAYLLCENDQVVCSSILLIQPSGFGIPSKTIEIHGITEQYANRHGQPIQAAMAVINTTMRKVDCVIAHYLQFDLGILQSEAMRLDYALHLPPKRRCTAHLGRHYLRKEHSQRCTEFPRLSDLYRKLFNSDYAPKHDALSDATACWQVYRRLKALGYVK